MDALTPLQEVSSAYRILHTLSLEATIVMESGDENANNRNLHRIRFFYTHPNLLRFEPFGKNGTTVIADGHQLHTTFRRQHMPPGPQHSSIPLTERFKPRLTFERRLTFSEGDYHLTAHEHIVGPVENHKNRYHLKVG